MFRAIPQPGVSPAAIPGRSAAAAPGQNPAAASGRLFFPPEMCPGVHLTEVQARLHKMLGNAVRGSGSLFTREGLDGLVPRPEGNYRWWQCGRRSAYKRQQQQYARIQRHMRRAHAKLERLSTVNVADFSKDGQSRDAFALLDSTIKALYAVYGDLKSYGQSAGASVALASAQMEILFLAQELTNCAATAGGLTSSEIKSSGLQTMKEAVAQVSPFMHGPAEMLETVGREAAALFAELDDLEEEGGVLSPVQYTVALYGVDQALRQLKEKVDSCSISEKMYDEMMNSPQQNEGEISMPRFIGNAGAYSKLKDHLDNALLRAGKLRDADARGPIMEMVKELLPDLPPDLPDLLGMLPLEGAGLRDFLNRIRTTRAAIEAKLESDQPDDIPALLNTLWNSRSAENSRADELIKVLLKIITGKKKERGIFRRLRKERSWAPGDWRYKLAGARSIRRTACLNSIAAIDGVNREEELFDRALVLLEKNPALVKAIQTYSQLMKNSVFASSPELGGVECGRLVRMIAVRKDMNHLRSDYIKRAFDNSLSLTTVLNAAMLRIQPQYLALTVDDENLISSKELGKGFTGKVTLCRYRDGNGREQVRVFKPEISSRRALEEASAQRLGYDPEMQSMKLNVASSLTAKMLGCEELLVSSEIGTLNGKLGLFMSYAEGRSMKEIIAGGTAAVDSAGKKYTFPRLHKHFTEKGMWNAFRASLLKEYCRLEWVDCVTGQMDRHPANYIFTCDMDTAEVKIRGVDNDFSYSKALLGAGQLLLPPANREGGLAALRVVLEMRDVRLQDDNILDLRTAPRRCLGPVKKMCGLNQPLIPRMIDRGTYNSLMQIDVQDYLAALRPLLEEEALAAAGRRLRNMQEFARELEQKGLVIDNWEDVRLLEVEKQNRITPYCNDTNIVSMNGFFMRDIVPEYGRLFYAVS